MKKTIILSIALLAGFAAAQDQTGKGVKIPDELTATLFADTDLSPSPACLAASAEGEVFIGVDLLGSLGKGPGKGRIVRALDADHDGKADSHTVFAEIDNPRGLIPVGDKLYVLHTVIPKSTGKLEAMHLSVLEDKNRDGVADGPPNILVSDVSVPLHNQRRGADHTTNGIQMGIDGWIYIAVGDFGIVGARGSDGTELTMLGGGIVRVRPDGSEMEVYTHGLRNIYDVAIDPRMNLYTRGNTNDGGGWNIRFIHQVQSGEYGYPMLFKHFTGEVIPALADLGGGSGTGAMYFSEPGWPEKYTNVPMMCDWGRSQLIIHRVSPDGPSFTQAPEDFIKCHQIADVDVDGSGRLYLAAWNGAGFKGSPNKGYTVRVTPKGWTYKPFPDVGKASSDDLLRMIVSDSAKARHRAQRELITRKDEKAYGYLIKVAAAEKFSIDARVAAIFTAKQWKGAASTKDLVALIKHPEIREYVLRALADRVSQNSSVPIEIFTEALKAENPARVRVAAAVGLGRLGRPHAAKALIQAAGSLPPPESEAAPAEARPVFISETITRNSSANIKADITGMKQLVLAVLDGGNGTGSDHAVWLDPVLTKKDGSKVPLTGMKWKSAEQGWGQTRVGKDCTGKPIKLAAANAAPFTTGIGTHSTSFIVYPLDGSFTGFEARGALTAGGANGKIQFAVNSTKMGMSKKKKEGPHATPNPGIVVPHVAVQALRRLEAVPALVAALDGEHAYGALWALKFRHHLEAVDGIIAAHAVSEDPAFRRAAMETLLRLSVKEKPYDGTWWWGTRPDTHGPYYYTAPWEGTERIHAYVKKTWGAASSSERGSLSRELQRQRIAIDGLDLTLASASTRAPTVDLSKIDRSLGEVGKMSIENVMLALDDLKGDAKQGERLFTKQGCLACHTLTEGQALKGPFMGHVGGILSREQIAEAILNPSATISQGFPTVSITRKKGDPVVGFITAQSAKEVELRDITGKVTRIKTGNIKNRQDLEVSSMPPGLANPLSMKEFASLVRFLSERKK